MTKVEGIKKDVTRLADEVSRSKVASLHDKVVMNILLRITEALEDIEAALEQGGRLSSD